FASHGIVSAPESHGHAGSRKASAKIATVAGNGRREAATPAVMGSPAAPARGDANRCPIGFAHWSGQPDPAPPPPAAGGSLLIARSPHQGASTSRRSLADRPVRAIREYVAPKRRTILGWIMTGPRPIMASHEAERPTP